MLEIVLSKHHVEAIEWDLGIFNYKRKLTEEDLPRLRWYIEKRIVPALSAEYPCRDDEQRNRWANANYEAYVAVAFESFQQIDDREPNGAKNFDHLCFACPNKVKKSCRLDRE